MNPVSMEALQKLANAAPEAPRPVVTVPSGTANTNGKSPYGEAALTAELANLHKAARGNRNNQLNESAFALGQLVGGGVLSEGEVTTDLERVGLSIGLDPSEVKSTIQSGLSAGTKKPRYRPEKSFSRNGHHQGAAGDGGRSSQKGQGDDPKDAPADAPRDAQEASATSQTLPSPVPPTAELLDVAPALISKPLCLIGDHAYAATWAYARVTVSESVKGKRTIKHDPPLVLTEQRLLILRDDGAMFADNIDGIAKPLSDLKLDIHLPEIPPTDKLWSAQGVKRYQNGQRPEAAFVFKRITDIVKRFIDFDKSLADQATMCEFLACYILATWLLDAFNVAGFIWPTGERGSGKTQTMALVAEMGYLGQLILAGGSFASLRDLADYGAFLAFDDAENLSNPKRTDPDKRALLLAGNRKGNTVPVKEPTSDRGWRTRHVNTFCPRGFTAIQLPDQVLASRTIVIPLIRTTDRGRANNDPLDYKAWPHDRRALLDDLWALALANLSRLPGYDRLVGEKARLQGRNLEPWRAVLATAMFLSEEGVSGLWKRMEDLSAAYQKERANVDAPDLMTVLIRVLCILAAKKCGVRGISDMRDIKIENTVIRVHTATITKAALKVAELCELDMESDPITSRRVGRLMGRLRFKRGRENGTGKRMWEFTPREAKDWADRYELSPGRGKDKQTHNDNVTNGTNVTHDTEEATEEPIDYDLDDLEG